MAKSLISFLLGLASIQAAAATPFKVYPEVIPGPGLPSLAELNLTSAQLYEKGPPDAAFLETLYPLAGRAAAYTPQCGPSEAAYANVNDIIACFNYLRGLGSASCVATRGIDGVQMCRAGSAQIVGWSISNRQAASHCNDVASAVLWTIDSCTRPNQSCAGSQAAWGNGDLIIASVNVNW